MQLFQDIEGAAWKQLFHDPCTGNWEDLWALDGRKATVANGKDGMSFAAGPVFGDAASHAVLWTKLSFKGDIRIDFEYTRLDEARRGVVILYLLATGSGRDPYLADIARWSELRTVPSMPMYYNNMHTYHVSFSAFGNKDGDPAQDYIRARRYMPETGMGLKDTELKPDYLNTGFFKTGLPHAMTAILKNNDLFMHIRAESREMLCHWKTDSLPPITVGRIGFRHMGGRSARYRDIRIATLDK